ncbi:MAG: hypothetical protein ACTS80_01295 [Candidatus Hodgkinia cicadicola]
MLNEVKIAQITLFKQVCAIMCANSVCTITNGFWVIKFRISGKVLKPSQPELARCGFATKPVPISLTRRLKSISVQTKSIKSAND